MMCLSAKNCINYLEFHSLDKRFTNLTSTHIRHPTIIPPTGGIIAIHSNFNSCYHQSDDYENNHSTSLSHLKHLPNDDPY